ncbi:hypothetical protein Y1Q_0008365 [Alligator mississippiensis]|uniref:Uncharacterized protein n=1 Tax=Alligator mississippiensis TaxID=8496 RepID=A0A151N1V6_ALLMI|nr:hypothetical protein Y1Q_0008365 [Alligator mississippiensis]
MLTEEDCNVAVSSSFEDAGKTPSALNLAPEAVSLGQPGAPGGCCDVYPFPPLGHWPGTPCEHSTYGQREDFGEACGESLARSTFFIKERATKSCS